MSSGWAFWSSLPSGTTLQIWGTAAIIGGSRIASAYISTNYGNRCCVQCTLRDEKGVATTRTITITPENAANFTGRAG